MIDLILMLSVGISTGLTVFYYYKDKELLRQQEEQYADVYSWPSEGLPTYVGEMFWWGCCAVVTFLIAVVKVFIGL